MSILQRLVRDSDHFQVAACTPGWQDKDINLIMNVRIPVDKITEQEWFQFDDDYVDPETGSEYYIYDSDLTETHRTGQLSINVVGSDVPIAVDLVTGDLIKLSNEIRSLQSSDNGASHS